MTLTRWRDTVVPYHETFGQGLTGGDIPVDTMALLLTPAPSSWFGNRDHLQLTLRGAALIERANSPASLISPLKTYLLTLSWFLLGPPRLSRIGPAPWVRSCHPAAHEVDLARR
jgi:hypothetical protein